jgi:hypothetical protein
MILGMSLSTLTMLHTVISLIGIAAGIVAVNGMLSGKRLNGWTAVFLLTTILTSVTGFFFPFTTVLPSHIFGVISLLVLPVVLVALYVKHLIGAWRWIYVAGAVLALYLNVFVGVVMAFRRLPFLTPLAPTQSEPPFLIAQVVVLMLFVALGIVAAKKFHPQAAAA